MYMYLPIAYHVKQLALQPTKKQTTPTAKNEANVGALKWIYLHLRAAKIYAFIEGYFLKLVNDDIIYLFTFSLKKLIMRIVYYQILEKEKFMINMGQWVSI